MIITYLRSSSYTNYDFCEFQFLLNYGLSLPSPPNRKAFLGNVVHKALEILANKKLAEQNGLKTFIEAETGLEFKLEEITHKTSLDISFEFHQDMDIHHLVPSDRKFCAASMDNVLNFKNGLFYPLNRNVVQVEQFFDFIIEKDWAKYEYNLPDGQKISGYLGMKGTLDLVTSLGHNEIELIDWKTGKRMDWNTGKPKDYAAIKKDPQLLLYNYAIRKLYPDHDIFTTIFFTADGGPTSLFYDDEDMEKTEAMIKKRFEEVRNNIKPQRIWNTSKAKLMIDGKYIGTKCQKLCWFGKNSFSGPEKDFKKTICQVVHTDLINLGMDRVVKKYCKDMKQEGYTGGGRSNI